MKPLTRKQTKRLMSQPVYVLLNDGSHYVGWITGVEKQRLMLSGVKGKRNQRQSSSSRSEKARISGLLGGLFNPFSFAPGAGNAVGGAATAGGIGGLGGFGGFMGFMQKALPVFNMGFGMIKTIMPLLGAFKA
jgi:small nuclear ribonucleoprotein (snRNP)-like protein